MDVIVITGAPGVGKTALLPLLSEALPGQNAWLDGDVVGRTKPIDRTRERLDLIQDNICACARNFAAWGARYFITCYVLPSQERVERLANLLRSDKHRVWFVAITAHDDVLVDRHKQKGDWAAKPEFLDQAVGCNNGVKALSDVTSINTTHMGVQQVADEIVSHMQEEDVFA